MLTEDKIDEQRRLETLSHLMTRLDVSEDFFTKQLREEKNQNLIVEALVEQALKKLARRNRQRFSKSVIGMLTEEFKKDKFWDKAKRNRLAK